MDHKNVSRSTHSKSKTSRSRRNTDILILLMIVALALILRLWGTGFGLPYTFHYDEHFYVNIALNLGAGIVGYPIAPTGFSIILLGEYGAYFIAGSLTGLFASVADFANAYRTDPGTFLLLGRITAALLGTLAVLGVYWIGKAAHSKRAAFLGALFLGVSFLHVRDSHFAVNDVPGATAVVITVWMCALAVQRRKARYWYLAAAAAGYAIATKFSLWPIASTILVLALYEIRCPAERSLNINLGRLLTFAALSFAAGFLIGGFPVVLKPAIYFDYAFREWQSGSTGGFGLWQIDTVSGWVFYLKTLGWGMGVPLLTLGIAGVLHRIFKAVTRRDWMSLLLLAFLMTYYLFMGVTRHYFARYAVPLVPFVALFAGEALTDGIAAIRGRRPALEWGVLIIATIGFIILPLSRSIRSDHLLTVEDTRVVAKKWVETNVPDGAKIAIDWVTYGPPLSTLERSVPHSNRVYDATSIGGTGLADRPITWYREQGFEYLIASSFIYNIPLVYEDRHQERQAFYEALDQEFRLIKEFYPDESGSEPPFIFDEIYGPAVSLWHRERPGPVMKIYQVVD